MPPDRGTKAGKDAPFFTTRARDFYENNAAAYDSAVNRRFYERIATALAAKVSDSPVFKAVLEIGAGTGFATAVLHERYPQAEITALEPSRAMTARGRTYVPQADWIEKPLSDFNWERTGLVFASMSYHWLTQPERSKLKAAATDGVLALAVAVTDRPEDEEEEMPKNAANGNQALKRVAYHLRPSTSWSRADRRARTVTHELKDGFREVTREYVTFDETFDSGRELIDTLDYRGSLLALFSSRRDEARRELARTLDLERPAAFRWRAALIVGRS